ncbi:MAG: hypothetical protein ACK528_02500 [Alphaproteobacteria bacterium]
MSNLVAFKQAGLPAVSSLSSALRVAAQSAAPAGGTVILKMDRTGHWVFGADQDEVEPGSKWAVNPYSFTHGYIAWGDGQVLGEKMAPMTEPLPEVEAAPPGASKGWEMQIGFSLKCISGEDAGMEARYTATSVGGKRSVQELALAVAEQADKDSSKIVAVVTLGKDHYQHKSYGRIYTPVFDVQEWVGMNGPEAQADEPQAEPTEPAPTRRRRVA